MTTGLKDFVHSLFWPGFLTDTTRISKGGRSKKRNKRKVKTIRRKKREGIWKRREEGNGERGEYSKLHQKEVGKKLRPLPLVNFFLTLWEALRYYSERGVVINIWKEYTCSCNLISCHMCVILRGISWIAVF